MAPFAYGITPSLTYGPNAWNKPLYWANGLVIKSGSFPITVNDVRLGWATLPNQMCVFLWAEVGS